jgi:hypothetical protein
VKPKLSISNVNAISDEVITSCPYCHELLGNNKGRRRTGRGKRGKEGKEKGKERGKKGTEEMKGEKGKGKERKEREREGRKEGVNE